MTSFKGEDFEAAVVGHLRSMGFSIDQHEDWDHVSKIDFVITKFPRYPRCLSLGVQVTTRCGDEGKRSEFVAKNDGISFNSTVADKALFLEIDRNIDLNKGGAEVAASILYSFQFDERFADFKVWAASIHAGTSSVLYRFFDPRQEQINAKPCPILSHPQKERLQVDASSLAPQVSHDSHRKIQGTLHTYKPESGYGFISAQDRNTYFMHISEARDPGLLDILNSFQRGAGKSTADYVVQFEDGGKSKPAATYPTARNVQLVTRSYGAT